jgi:hypothetical protein
LVKSFKLVPRPLDEGPRPKSGKLRLIWHVLEGKSIGLDQKTVIKGKLLIWITNNQATDPVTLQLKDSSCFT